MEYLGPLSPCTDTLSQRRLLLALQWSTFNYQPGDLLFLFSSNLDLYTKVRAEMISEICSCTVHYNIIVLVYGHTKYMYVCLEKSPLLHVHVYRLDIIILLGS